MFFLVHNISWLMHELLRIVNAYERFVDMRGKYVKHKNTTSIEMFDHMTYMIYCMIYVWSKAALNKCMALTRYCMVSCFWFLWKHITISHWKCWFYTMPRRCIHITLLSMSISLTAFLWTIVLTSLLYSNRLLWALMFIINSLECICILAQLGYTYHISEVQKTPNIYTILTFSRRISVQMGLIIKLFIYKRNML